MARSDPSPEARRRRRGLPQAQDRAPAPTRSSRSCSPGISPIAPRALRLDRAQRRENDVIGNWYATQFADAWAVAEYAAANIDDLAPTHTAFAAAVRETTIPAAVKDAARANLSTLVSTTLLPHRRRRVPRLRRRQRHSRLLPRQLHPRLEYETATAHVFPSLSRSLRRSAFGCRSTTRA